MLVKKNFISSIRLNAYAEDDGGTATQDSNTSTDQSDQSKTEEPVVGPEVKEIDTSNQSVFTQDQVNNILKKDREKHQAQTTRALDELNMLKSKAQITSEEREALENTISQLKNDMLTKEQRMERDKKAVQEKLKSEIDNLTKDRDAWQNKYTESTIIRAITDAAANNKAVAPKQIVALLRPQTRLAEAFDDDGNSLGEVPKVKFEDLDKDGKPYEADLPVQDAVQRMTQLDEYANLFQGDGTGGVGKNTRSGGGRIPDIVDLIRNNPEEYRRLRNEGKITDADVEKAMNE